MCEGDEKILVFNGMNEVIFSSSSKKKTRTFQFEDGRLGLRGEAKQSQSDIRVFKEGPSYSGKDGVWLQTGRQRYDLVINRFSGVVDEVDAIVLDDGSKMMTKYVGKCAAAAKRF